MTWDRSKSAAEWLRNIRGIQNDFMEWISGITLVSVLSLCFSFVSRCESSSLDSVFRIYEIPT